MSEDPDKFVAGVAQEIADRVAAQLDVRPLLDVKGLADRLSVSERTAYALLAGSPPAIPSFLIGTKQRRVRPQDVDAYLRVRQASEEGSDGTA